MFARSTVSVDRPFVGRSAAAVLGLMVTLIASLAIGVTAARAADDTQVAEQSAETVQSATATAEPTSEPPVAPAQESVPVVDEPAEPAPEPATEPAPAETKAPAPEASPEPAEVAIPEAAEPKAAEPQPAAPAAPEPAPAKPPSAAATATNQAQIWQAIFQVQQGCQSHCQGTSQSQTAEQVAETVQSATAIGGGTGSPSSATAVNQSTTGQFIWQVQLGCVAFCYGTSQSQTANQWAQTTQNATATAEGSAQAHNVGSVMQEVWQLQYGCQTECYGNSQTQSSTQGQSTSQSATATSETWSHSHPSDAQSLLPAWLVALAENLGITIQTSWQFQQATCVEHCVGDSQAQQAAQSASTTQSARAVAGVPPEEPQPPVAAVVAAEEPAPVPAVAKAAGAGSSRTVLERVSASWRRVSRDARTGSRLRGGASVSSARSRAATSTGTRMRVESSARETTGSYQAKATAVTTAKSRTVSSSTDGASTKVKPLGGLAEADSGYGLLTWLLVGLLMAFGLANLRRGFSGARAG